MPYRAPEHGKWATNREKRKITVTNPGVAGGGVCEVGEESRPIVSGCLATPPQPLHRRPARLLTALLRQ